ncbi:MAG: biofilm-associated protein [Candidatus Nitrosotenuis sp.]
MFSKVGRMIVTDSTLVVFGLALFSLFAFVPAFAATVVESTNFEKTTILEFTNNDNIPVKTIRIWLGVDAGTFKSFKTESGWTGLRTPQGVLVFTTNDALDPGESVKFGVKTEVESPGINWKTMDASGNELTIGKAVPGQTSQPPETQPPAQETQPTPTNLDNAVFKIIPGKPKNGDSIRIVGYGFPPNKQFNFLIDGEKLEDFLTDTNGNLLGRAKIPVTKAADRVEFSMTDDQGNSKVISVRIDHRETQMVSPQARHLTVDKFVELVEPGQVVSSSGTGEPGSAITITVQDPSGTKIYEAVVTVNSQGLWSHVTTIPPDAPLGTRKVIFSDGIDSIEKTFSISVSKTIRITSSAIKYNPGEKMVFNGTALTGKSVEVVINDPIGKEIFSDILTVSDSGDVSFEYQTQSTSTKGTYVVIFTQEQESEILRIGLGEIPGEQIVAKFDKLNYLTSEKAKLTLQGPAKAVVSLLIIDPSDKAKISDNITLGLDGRAEYELSLTNYKSGVYSMVIKYQKFQTTVVFSVGLQTSSGPIQIQTTKQTYHLGDSILILGSTNPNSLLKIEMSDPAGNVIKRKEIFSDKEGKFSDGTFRVPSDAKDGVWVIKATSGPNLAEAKLTVAGTIDQAFVVTVNKSTIRAGEIITITGTGGGKTQTTIIKIFDPKNAEIEELSMSSTKEGSFQTIWTVPLELQPGVYKIKATVGGEMAETTFTVQ